MEKLWQDFRYGLRMLAKSPAFTAAAVIALALGIGANAAIFSVVNATLLKSLPYPHPDRIMAVWSTFNKGEIEGSSPPDYRQWRAENHSFSEMGAFWYGDANLSGSGGEPEWLEEASISASLFPALGIAPALGRNFLPEEAQYGRNHEAILSYALWQERFGGDPRILGRTIILDDRPVTVVGVMPRGMPFFDNNPEVAVWLPLSFAPNDDMNTRQNHFLIIAGRLRPGVSPEQAESELKVIARRIAAHHPENENLSARVVPLDQQLVGDVRPALLILLAAVGLVLLIACANVANLLLTRAKAREREMAIRAAMGAGTGRLVSQLILEGVPLGLLGGGGGLILAAWGVPALTALVPSGFPRFNPIGVDAAVVGFTAAVSLLTAVLFGLAPAFVVSRSNVQRMLREGGRGATTGRSFHRLRSAFVIAEVALAVVVLAGSGLLLRTFSQLRQTDPGFNPQNVLEMMTPFSLTRYQLKEDQIAFFAELTKRVQALPGVVSAGVGTQLPLDVGGGWGKYMSIPSHPAPTRLDQVADVRFKLVDSGYFPTLRLRLREGRFFTAADTATSGRVAIVNQALADRYFPGENPMGKAIVMDAPASLEPPPPPGQKRTPPLAIIGVIANVKNRSMGLDAAPEVYAPITQSAQQGWDNAMRFAVRTKGDPLALAQTIRAQVHAIDPNQPVALMATMDQLVGRSLGPSRFAMVLFALFAAVALVLSLVGVYAVVSYSVGQRAHEIGVRMALGAAPGEVCRMVLRYGMRLSLAGILVGLAGALAFTRLMQSLLYHVGAADPATFLSISALLAAMVLLACYVPARRAARLDPAAALRNE
jgi:putative ABC transport system permease protein